MPDGVRDEGDKFRLEPAEMTEATTPVRPGDIVAGKYRVDGVLGVGGMGVVVAATHVELDQKVALKFLLPAVLSKPEIVARFLREARAAVKIKSEHVARVMDVGTLETAAPYMVMEYLEGEDLEQVLERRGSPPLEETVGYLLQACEAIAEAHALGIVHRDLKPANLFLARGPGGKPTVKVLDFGISKLPLSEKEQALTKETSMMGSPAYMSPEQLKASRDVDARSDIWSLGVVLYELIARRVPFAQDSMGALVAAVMYDTQAPVRSTRGDVPPALERVVNRCLEKDPAKRYDNIAELARALLPFGPPRSEQSVERIEHALGHVSQVRDVPPRTVLASPLSDAQMERSAMSATITTPNRRGAKLLLIVGVAAAIGAVAAIVHTFRASPSTDAPTALAAPSPPSVAVAVTTQSATVDVSPALPSAPTPSTPIADSAAVPQATNARPSGSARARPRALPSATATAAPTPAASGPICKVVSYFDGDGNKHFKQECQ